MYEDDELVYPLNTVRQNFPIPHLRFLHAVPGRKSLRFELFLRSVSCVGIVDSGATHSFVSREFCSKHHLHYATVSSSASLADGTTSLPVVGVLWNTSLKMYSFSCKQSFLVLDHSSCDVVIGMDWLEEHDPLISFRKRRMQLRAKHGPITIHAVGSEPLPPCSSSCIEICTLDGFARSLCDESDIDLAGAVVASLQHVPDPASLAGPGADEPDVAPLLQEFHDVLVPEIPGGLPPVRFANDGRPIECCVDTEPDAKPYARPPKPFTTEELDEIQKYLDDFLAKGWIVPSLSPWAAPVLFVPKKLDPVTGKRSWRMCISYVKLNSKTLNRIAYRLPRISDLLAKVSRSKFFSKFDLLSGFYQIRMRASDIPKNRLRHTFWDLRISCHAHGALWCSRNISTLNGRQFRCAHHGTRTHNVLFRVSLHLFR
jgi:hypothetical protein